MSLCPQRSVFIYLFVRILTYLFIYLLITCVFIHTIIYFHIIIFLHNKFQISSESILKNKESTVSVAIREKKKMAAADSLKAQRLSGIDSRMLSNNFSGKSTNNDNNNDVNNHDNNNDNGNPSALEADRDNLGYSSTFSSNSPAAAATAAAMRMKYGASMMTSSNTPPAKYSFAEVYNLSAGAGPSVTSDTSITPARTYDDKNSSTSTDTDSPPNSSGLKRLKPPPLSSVNSTPISYGTSSLASLFPGLTPTPPPPPPVHEVSPTSTVPLRRLSSIVSNGNFNNDNNNGNSQQWVQSPEATQPLCSINETEVVSNNSLNNSINSGNSLNNSYNKRSLSIMIAGPVTCPVSLLSGSVVAREVRAICHKSAPKGPPPKIKNTPSRSNSFNAGIFTNNANGGSPKSIHSFFSPAMGASIAQSLGAPDGDCSSGLSGMLCCYNIYSLTYDHT